MNINIGNLLLPILSTSGRVSSVSLSSLRKDIQGIDGNLYFQTNICEGAGGICTPDAIRITYSSPPPNPEGVQISIRRSDQCTIEEQLLTTDSFNGTIEFVIANNTTHPIRLTVFLIVPVDTRALLRQDLNMGELGRVTVPITGSFAVQITSAVFGQETPQVVVSIIRT